MPHQLHRLPPPPACDAGTSPETGEGTRNWTNHSPNHLPNHLTPPCSISPRHKVESALTGGLNDKEEGT
jgi:hypothetical protein